MVTPHVFGAATVGYDDNVLREDWEAPGTLRREAYSDLEAGLRLDTELGDHRLEVGYRARGREYWNTGFLDTFQHEGSLRLDLYGVDVEGHLDAAYRRVVFPQSIQLRGLIRIDTYNARAWTEVRFGRVGVRVGGSAFRTDYVRRSFSGLDSWNYRLDCQVYFRVLPKLRALVEYNWSVVEYDAGRGGGLNDFMFHQLRAGVDGAFTPKLSASLKAGASYQEVDFVSGRDRSRFRGFVMEASVGWRPFAGTTLSLAVSRTLEPSLQSNFLVNDVIRAAADKGLFGGDLTVGAFVQYERGEVSQFGRTSAHLNRFRTGARGSYKIKSWLSVVGTYEFVRLGSPFPNNDYRQHQVTLSLGAGI